MKIKKLLPQEVTDKTLAYKAYRKVVKPALKKMITEHNAPEKSTQFLIKTDYEFTEMKGKKMGFIILGDQTPAWLKVAKEEIKGDKKNTCYGTCYVKKNADGSYVLVLLPEKGAAKKNMMKKQLEKFALKSTPFSIEIGAGGELEEDNPADVVLDDVALPDEEEVEEEGDDESDSDEAVALTAEQIKIKQDMIERLSNMDAQIKKVKEQLKM